MSMPVAADQRSLVGVPAVFSWQPVDGDGIAATAGTVTVDILRGNGTVLVTAGATVGTGTGIRTYTLAAASCALMDFLTAVWKDGGVERARTTLELVGGYFASIADIRSSDPTLTAGTYPNSDVIRARTEVEHAFASLTACDFAPRYHRERINGSGTGSVVLGWGPIRSIRSVTVYSGITGTAWTVDELAAVPASAGRVATGTGVWPFGVDNIVVEYESGLSALPFDLRDQFFIEVRKQLNDSKSTVQLATPYDYDGGDPVDLAGAAQIRRLFSTLGRYSMKTPGIA